MPDNSQLTRFTLTRDLFLTAKEAAGVSARTLAGYRDALERFTAWLTAQGITDPQAITPVHLRRYMVHLQGQPYTTATVHTMLRPVKTWLRFLNAEDVIAVDVFAKIPMPKQDKPVLPAFTADDVRALLAACDDAQDPDRDRALILVLLDTGVRAAELCDLTIADLDRKLAALTVRRGKGGKGRTVYLGPQSKRAMLRYLLSRAATLPHDPLFPSLQTGGKLTPNSLLLLCRRLGARADVAHCHPHTFRRTFALWSLRAGMDLARLAKLMGHADLQIVKQYLDLAEGDLADAHAQHGPVATLLSKEAKR